MSDHRDTKSERVQGGVFSMLRWIIIPVMLGYFSWYNMDDIKRRLDEVIRCLKQGCAAIEQLETPKHRNI